MAVHAVSLNSNLQFEILAPDEVTPQEPLCILAHGAGNDMNSPFLSTITQYLEYKRINTLRFNFPYKTAGKKAPDSSPVLEETWKRVIDWTGKNIEHNGLFIGGKSMGGRIASMIAANIAQLKGLIFLGYPLHPPGKFDQKRDEYLLDLQLPMLFIQGTRDPFARMDLLQETIHRIRDRVTLHWIEGGDHSFKVLVRTGQNYPEILKNVAGTVADWIREIQ